MSQPAEEHDRCAGCPGCGPDRGEATDASSASSPSAEVPSETPERWPLVASIGFFLLPIVLAIAGAILGRAGPSWQLLGAVVGLTVGVGLAWACGWLLAQRE